MTLRAARPTCPSTDTNPSRWLALVFIALAQLMVALDATIVSVALPSVQRALAFDDAHRQWVVTAYTLPFAGLLLLGGRLADVLGRRRAMLIALSGFAAASALGGAALDLRMLIVARGLQGMFAALLSPSALSLIAVTFTEPHERAKAFGIYGAVAGSGAALGLLLGGVLTEVASWRWCLHVNVFIAGVAIMGCRATLPRARAVAGQRLDLLGALLGTCGLIALVYAFSRAPVRGWGAPSVLVVAALALLVLVLFVFQESRVAFPLLPLRLVRDRNRGGACMAAGLAVVGVFGVYLVLTYFFQVVLRYSPLRAGLAFLPMTLAGLIGAAALAARLLPHVAPRMIMVPGLLVAGMGMLLLTRIHADARYLRDVMPAEIAIGVGVGCAVIAALSVATLGVDAGEAGVASAMVTTSQQVGSSIGTALLNSVATVASAAYAATHAASGGGRVPSLVHGYATAAGCAACVLGLAAILVWALVNAPPPLKRSLASTPRRAALENDDAS